MNEAKRVLELLNLLKTNALQFSKQTGIQQTSLSAITLGKKRITIEILHRIIKTHPEVNIDWLMKGVGEPFLQAEPPPENLAQEEKGVYSALKSSIYIPNDGLPQEDDMKHFVAENLRAATKRWEMTQSEMINLLGANVGKGAASTYFRGDILPRLPQLLRLERFTGWPLVVLSTRHLLPDEIPPAPLISAPVDPVRFSAAQVESFKDEFHRLRLRLARMIEHLEGEEAPEIDKKKQTKPRAKH